jgi:hypothetical protein
MGANTPLQSARAFLLVLLLLQLASPSWGQETIFRASERQLSFHGIDITIAENGSARVEEQYFFTFFAGQDEQFEIDFEQNTPSLFEWKSDYPFIHPYVGSESQTENIEFLLNRTANQEPTLTLSYDYPIGLTQTIKVGSEGRSTRWKLADIALVQFIAGGNINIPTNTQIRIHFPNTAVVDTKLLPPGITLTGNTMTITNFQSNSLPIEYTVLTPIADPIDAGKIFDNAVKSPFFAFFIAIIAAIGLYIALNRDELSEKVENYVIEHSEFRPQPKQDIDADLDAEGPNP